MLPPPNACPPGGCDSDLVWKPGLCRWSQVKVKSYWIEVGLQSNDRCPYERKAGEDLGTQRVTEERPCDDRGRDWRDAATAKEHPEPPDALWSPRCPVEPTAWQGWGPSSALASLGSWSQPSAAGRVQETGHLLGLGVWGGHQGEGHSSPPSHVLCQTADVGRRAKPS